MVVKVWKRCTEKRDRKREVSAGGGLLGERQHLQGGRQIRPRKYESDSTISANPNPTWVPIFPLLIPIASLVCPAPSCYTRSLPLSHCWQWTYSTLSITERTLLLEDSEYKPGCAHYHIGNSHNAVYHSRTFILIGKWPTGLS